MILRTSLLLTLVCVVYAAELPAKAEVIRLIDQAQAWELTQAQPSGALAPGALLTLGLTAFSAVALTAEPQAIPVSQPAVAGGVRYLLKFRQPDGGVYHPDEGLGVYGTSLALILAMRLPDHGGFDVPAMQRYLFGQQNPDPGLGQGGIGYGDKGKGFEDLSNTGYALQALHASGVPADDARMQAALAFLQRCQDRSATNPEPWVKNSGGGVYGPQEAARSWSKGDETQAMRWTPTGSMTYELLSSYLVLDLKNDDPRVQAALGWITRNYSFERNPGMGEGKELQGLFHTHALAATTFDLLGSTTLTLPDGSTADWRSDLWQALSTRALPAKLADGSEGRFWINEQSRWGEGLPVLCTAYAIRSLKAVAKTLP